MILAARNGCTGADSNVSVAGPPMGSPNVISRHCTVARLVLHLHLTISILSLGLFMTSLSGCALPVGPRFEDPPAVENVPPFIKSSMPLQGSTVAAINNAQIFSITFTDLNADALHVRWVVEYPPYKTGGVSHLLVDKDFARPVNGQAVDTGDMQSVACFNGLALTDSHAITVFVSDQPLWTPATPGAPTDPGMVLTQNIAGSVMAQANWTLNLPCH